LPEVLFSSSIHHDLYFEGRVRRRVGVKEGKRRKKMKAGIIKQVIQVTS
jgi:hypothetical protein